MFLISDMFAIIISVDSAIYLKNHIKKSRVVTDNVSEEENGNGKTISVKNIVRRICYSIF